MRTIRFRFYDKDLKKMCFRSPAKMDFSHPNIIPMQFTGLLDKNGKDVYEGDIMTAISTEGYRYEVKFFNGSFCLFSKHGFWGEISKIESISEKLNIQVNVIGNIHENPELL